MKQVLPRIKLLLLLLYLLLIAAVTVSSSAADGNYDFSDSSFVLSLKLMQIVSVMLVFILPAFLFTLFLTNEKLLYLQLHKKVQIQSVLFVLLIIVSMAPLINWMTELNGKMILPASMSSLEHWMKASEEQYTKLTEAFLKMNTIKDLLFNLFVIAFLAALGEEILFRGVLQKTLRQSIKNIHIAIWLTAIIFSAFHFQFYGFFPRMMLGVLLGYLFVWSNSLWLPIIAHFTNNGLAVVLEYLNTKKIITFDADKIGTSNNTGILWGSIVLVSIFIFAVYRNRSQKSEDRGDETEVKILD